MRKKKRWIRSLVGWILSLTILLNPLQGVVHAAEDVGAIAREAEGLQESDVTVTETEMGEIDSIGEDESAGDSDTSEEALEPETIQPESESALEPETLEPDVPKSGSEQESEWQEEAPPEEVIATLPEEAEQFISLVGELPEYVNAENYESCMSLFGQCFNLYSLLSESNKSLPEVEEAYRELNRVLETTYGTQTLEVGYYTDHNTIMIMPQGYMGVADWGWCRYRTVSGDVAYCIEPEVGVEGAGPDYPLSSGSTPNISLTDYQKRALAYVMRYGYDRRDVPEDWQTSFGVGNQAAVDRNMAISHPNDLCYYAATQVIIWAVVRGYPLTEANREEIRDVSNNCWGTHMFTTSQIGSMQRVYYEYFNSVWNNAMNAMRTTVPSFAASSGFSYPTHTMRYNASTGKYQVTLNDTNGVVASVYQTYTGAGSGVSVSRSGNSITISSSSPISGNKLVTSTPVSGTSQAQVPTAKLIYWTWTTQDWQMFASYGTPTTESVKAYFYLNSEQTGYVRLTKTAADTGGTLSGAVYGIYSDQACTKQVATMTTGSGGVAVSTALNPTTYYVKEIQAPAGYQISSVIHTVEVGSGVTVSISATDDPARKMITLTKRIKASDIHFDHGNPTFIFKVVGTDFKGTGYVYYRVLEFTEEYVKQNTASDGYVSLSVTIDGLMAGQYTASELETSRYELSEIINVSGGSIGASLIAFDLNTNAQGSAVFVNNKYENGYFSHCDMVENIIG